MNYDIRERAEIVSLAQQCSKELSAQPLIDYFESRRISDTPILSAVPSEDGVFIKYENGEFTYHENGSIVSKQYFENKYNLSIVSQSKHTATAANRF